MDGTALKDLFNGWTTVLHSREDQVPPFHGFSEDPAAALGINSKPEKWVCWGNVVRGIGRIVFILRTLIARLWIPTSDVRIVCVPGWFVSQLREKAMNELTVSGSVSASRDGKEEKSFISEGDILLAWKARTSIAP